MPHIGRGRSRGRSRGKPGVDRTFHGIVLFATSMNDGASSTVIALVIDQILAIASMSDGASSSCVATIVDAPTIVNTPGSFDVVVPSYSTMDIELWGGGASGGENTATSTIVGNYNSYSAAAAGNNGADTTIPGLTLNAKGGHGPVAAAINNQQAGGTAQTPTGGTTNTAGNAGESNLNGGGGDRGGAGGSAPNGGAGGARITGSGNSDQGRNGNDGVAPGGGGSGDLCSVFSLGDGWHHNGAAGGASGSYLKKTYVAGALGSPAPGDHITGTIGAGGAAPNADPGATRSFLAGKGADGRAKFTFTP